MNTQPSFLYIEDHPASRRVMDLMLKEVMGYQQVIILEDSANVLEKLAAINHSFDIIFLDLNVEPLSGFEVLTQLREQADYANVKIIALTASITSSDLEEVRSAGFNGVIGKPISPTLFPEQVKRILEGEAVWEVD
jgi:two-component system, cell cycle response regulator DivK